MNFYMVDESGNLGIAEKYFVLGMFNTRERIKVKRILQKFQKDYTHQLEIKGSQLDFTQKQTLINNMKDIDYTIHYMVADKQNTNLFKNNVDKNIIYNYLLSFIAIKVINDNKHLDKFIFHLDNHTIKVKSLNSFAEHIKLKALENDYYGVIEVHYFDSHKHILIQYADIISNVIYGKYERGKEHLYDLLKNKISTSFKFPINDFGK
ncbi:DUF3800 domain-containing protein [Sulfurospirillum arsenophilum]|uniref:DUF3800 domain-containing protein n=1 Tax=Sulfurospirillum arsenophilum TaxID=56698 RepID=UPI0005A7A51A|nr:DUF3800 domain-containing protein [Sulfurospirillum arsenophilum]